MKAPDAAAGARCDAPRAGGGGPALPVVFEARLMEEAVALALRGSPADPYWRARDAAYGEKDPAERERLFARLNLRAFERLDLDVPVRTALDEQPILASSARACFVAAAITGRDEGAELFVASPGERSILVRLRPASFGAPLDLLRLLRRELFHVADMVDPAFAYDPSLPAVDGGAVRLRLALDRYRVLWDTVIDGRLVRGGRLEPAALDPLRRRFQAAFPMLGERLGFWFVRWAGEAHPRHPELLEFALDPAAAAGLEADRPAAIGICPVCGSATRADALHAAMDPMVLDDVRREFPSWRPRDGICGRCIELYEARPLSRRAAAVLPLATAGEPSGPCGRPSG